MTGQGWQPGDIANGHILLRDGRWVPLTPDPPPAPPGAGQSPGSGPPVTVNMNNMSLAPVTSLVAGIIGVLCCWVPVLGVAGFAFGPVAVTFGLIGQHRGLTEHRVMATIGLICGVITLLVCGLWLAAFYLAIR